MCGRFAQYSGTLDFLEALAATLPVTGGYDNVPIARYNVAPATRVRLFRSGANGLVIDSVFWGWAPAWATRMSKPINARIEKVAVSRFYRQIWPHRCLIPANGWFEWLSRPAGGKQPYYIHASDDAPLFFAGVGQFEQRDSDGFVIITADAEGGLLDIHDRRPVVLPPAIARKWLNSETSRTEAERLLLQHSAAAEDFSWHAVGKAVGNVHNQGEKLIEPCDPVV